MKAQNRFFTRSQILRLAPLLLCATAGATPVLLKEVNNDGVWTLPTAPNLLNAALVTDPAPPSAHGNPDVTAASWGPLTDGVVDAAGTITNSVAPNNGTQVVFPLDLSVNTNGYTISQLDTYCSWQDSGRINQDYVLEYSKVSDPFTFLPLTVVSNPGSGLNKSTHVKVTDSTGTLASNVGSIRFTFNNQQNGYVGYREFILQGTAVPVSTPLTWAGLTNSNWVTTADSNWKNTTTGATAPYSTFANLTFDSSPTNRNIAIPTTLTSAMMTFSNGSSAPYTFSGAGTLNVTSDLVTTAGGAVTFNNPVTVGSGIAANGSGALTFSGSLQAKALSYLGGAVKLTGATPSIGSITGFDGSLSLGSASPLVNTVLTVGNELTTEYSGSVTSPSPAKGGITKVGAGQLTLSGTNSYTGVTTVSSGRLEFAYRNSLYNGNTASWTAANLLVAPGAALVLRAGGPDEFMTSDLTDLKTGGFQAGSFLGIDTFSSDFSISSPLTGTTGLMVLGANSLNLTAANTYTGGTKVVTGALNAANPSGASIPGNVTLGDGTGDNFLNFGADNQLPPTAVITFANGIPNTKLQLRGTSQTIGGLESATTNDRSIIQSDETGTPGFLGTSTTPSTLTINATTDHSWAGLIRNADGGPLAIIKNGPATQEFRNVPIQSSSNTGGLFINEGKVRLNFSGGATGYGSEITIAAPGTLALDGAFDHGIKISGPGKVVKEGTGTVRMVGSQNLYSGGTVVQSGNLVLFSNGSSGQGTAAGDHCNVGLMDPANVVTVNSGATLTLEAIAPLGNSGLLPAFAPSILIKEGAVLSGGNDTVAFVANLTLDGGKVDITKGANHGGFATNIALIGTTKVGGSSTVPATISTSGTDANTSNVSLGNTTLPEAIFQVADVTSSSADDLVVSSILKNVQGTVSSLTKTGPGTMHLTATNTYTGDTKVSAGTLILDQACLSDTGNVSIASGAILSLNHTQADTVASLTINGAQMAAGTYVATTNNAAGAIKTASITGTGSLVVGGSTGGGYDAWSAQITDSTKRGRDADPDGDGYTNLQEYLFGSSPVTASGPLVTSEKATGGLVVRWNQLATGSSTYVLQESADLVTWTPSTATVTNDPTQNNASYTLKQATVPVSGTRKFVRVQAAE